VRPRRRRVVVAARRSHEDAARAGNRSGSAVPGGVVGKTECPLLDTASCPLSGGCAEPGISGRMLGRVAVPVSRPTACPSRHPTARSPSVIAATQLKVGMVIMHNSKPHRVTNVLHVTPGNWRGMVQTWLVNIQTGSNTEHRFRSEDKVEKANMEQHSLQFSYRAGDDFHFITTENYEM